jgi:DinB superfamily
MKKQLEVINFARNGLIALMDSLTIEQINEIPEGFNNNLIWHFGHVIASQQGIGYLRTGVTPVVDMSVIDKYKNGTKPEGYIHHEEYVFMKNISESSLEQFEKDIESGLFNTYTAFNLSSGLEIASIDDALAMLCMHEGMHLGYAQALKRAVQK